MRSNIDHVLPIHVVELADQLAVEIGLCERIEPIEVEEYRTTDVCRALERACVDPVLFADPGALCGIASDPWIADLVVCQQNVVHLCRHFRGQPVLTGTSSLLSQCGNVGIGRIQLANVPSVRKI